MAETLQKLQPNRDLQCYFLMPSAIAALSSTSANGFTLSGTWRQQFDWAVVEWNRDNVFEHPSLRNLPDGDFSGLTLSYEEARENCIPLDSNLYPTVDWPNLRIWADDGMGEKVYFVPLKNYATPVAGTYSAATAELTLGGLMTPGDYVGFAFLDEHYSYQLLGADTASSALQNLAAAVNAFSPTTKAALNGSTITLSYAGVGRDLTTSTTGSNGNRVGVYTYTSGFTEEWDAPSRLFAGGTSPTRWQVTLPFASLMDPTLGRVPAQAVRKMRWTYAADLQTGAFQRSEFEVVVTNWAVSGSNAAYSVAGPGSRRIEDVNSELVYGGTWSSSSGNFSGGSIAYTTDTNASVKCSYYCAQTHSLYLGTRAADACGSVTASVDGSALLSLNLALAGEDVLTRKFLGVFQAGTHTVDLKNTGAPGSYFYFDYLEIAIPSMTLPDANRETALTLATDWDTLHSQALGAERTAWMIDALGFHGRVNHYVGALWFYELSRPGQSYASVKVTFNGTPDPNLVTTLSIRRNDEDGSIPSTMISHLNLIGDTATTLALQFALQINNGYTAIRAEASGNQLIIYSRSMGADGNNLGIACSAPTTNLTVELSSTSFTGGVDAPWLTDLTATPRINRAVRDWCRSFYIALATYGIDAAAAFSMELGNGDTSIAAGIAQRYPSQNPVWLNTPSLQTNFSPISASFWQQVYADMALIQVQAGLRPYLQFGEVQWWYFANDADTSAQHNPLPGMPYYDAYTTSTFLARYGRNMATIPSNNYDPAQARLEAEYLSSLIGAFTNQVIEYVKATAPTCRFEVLYPCDVNNTPWNTAVNYPTAAWTPTILDCLKTESFTYTYERNLDLARTTIDAGLAKGFGPSQRSHLVGIIDSTTAWLKEARMAQADGFESVVLFALDQFCLNGYALPLSTGQRQSAQMA